MGLFGRIFGGSGRERTVLDEDQRLERVLDSVLECCEYALFAGHGALDMAERVARRHPERECLACEPASEPYYAVAGRTEKVKNLYLFNQRPREFLLGVKHDKPYLMERDTLVVLSVAGGGAERRFFAEAAFVAANFAAPYLLALGCRVPGSEAFGADSNRGRECSLRNLRPCFAGVPHSLYFPNYALSPTRGRMPLGWALASLGRNAHAMLPEEAQPLVVKPDPEPAKTPAVAPGASGSPGAPEAEQPAGTSKD